MVLEEQSIDKGYTAFNNVIKNMNDEYNKIVVVLD